VIFDARNCSSVSPAIRLITQAERDSLREMANEVYTKVLDPGSKKKSGHQKFVRLEDAIRADL
jgi:hypothetical protein